jgi:haloacetate dehalogenase
MFFSDEAVAEYIRCFSNPATIHASCEDYRAAASIDLEHDRQNYLANAKITCPTLILWGKNGTMGQCYDVLETWNARYNSITGKGLSCGHYLAEEKPNEVYDAFVSFFN